MNQELIIEDFKKHSSEWIENFNKGNFEHCINAYLDDAAMIVKDVGEFNGKSEITEFWTQLTKTANYIEYSNINIEVIDEITVHLNASWKMNIAEGVISLEKWVKQNDNSWKLVQDEFEILKKY